MINSEKKKGGQNYLRLYTSMTVPCIFIETRGTSNPQVSPQNWKAITSWLPSFPNSTPLFSYPIFLFKEFSNLRATFVLKHCFLHSLLHPPSSRTYFLLLLSPPSESFLREEMRWIPGIAKRERKKGEERAHGVAWHSICRKFLHARIVLKSFSFKGTVWKFKWREKEGCIINRWGQPENSSPSLAWKLPSGEEIRIPPSHMLPPPFTFFALHWSRSSRLSHSVALLLPICLSFAFESSGILTRLLLRV